MRRPLVVVVSCIAAMLVPSLSAPARTIAVPEVLSRTTAVRGGAPATFDFPATHVVLSWEGHDGLEIRYRSVGFDGIAGPWRTAHEAHDLAKGDVHYSGVLAVGRAERLEWIPVLARGRSLPNLEVFYMNTEDGPIVERTLPATADAQASTPSIVSRVEWGADESLRRCSPNFAPIDRMFVHHTAGSNNSKDHYAMVRAIYEFHTEGRGWCDIGYNFLVAPDGTIFEGRFARAYSDWETPTGEDRSHNGVIGAHVAGHNTGSVGVSLMGTFTSTKPTQAARAALIDVLSWKADRHDLNPQGVKQKIPVIAGHRDAGPTACPGDNLYKDLPNVREDVALRVATGKTSTFTNLIASASKLNHGETVALDGSLVTEEGTPLAGRTVEIYSRAGGGWKLLSEEITGPDGSFTLQQTPARNTRYEARFVGDSTLWDSASGRRIVKIKPVVSLSTDAGDGNRKSPSVYASGEKVSLTGDVDPALSGRTVKVKIFRQRNNGTERLVRTKKVTLQTGYFATGYRPRKAGKLHRAVAWFPRGGGYAASRSPAVFFVAQAS